MTKEEQHNLKVATVRKSLIPIQEELREIITECQTIHAAELCLDKSLLILAYPTDAEEARDYASAAAALQRDNAIRSKHLYKRLKSLYDWVDKEQRIPGQADR